MKPIRLTLAAMLLLSACGGNPFVNEPVPTDPTTPVTPDPNGGITTEGGLPPGTTSPSPSTGISRYEPKGKDSADGDSGNGYVREVSYNGPTAAEPTRDTFTVDNLGFDGNNTFDRATPGTLNNVPGNRGTYALFDGKPSLPDTITGEPINQLQYRAIYGVSYDTNGSVKFAIVRTGSYVDYGFGGFIYSRAGGVTLPAEGSGSSEEFLTSGAKNPAYRGQAQYTGKVAGLRDFKGAGGMEMSTADMTMAIDFDDFNDGNAVRGTVYNRRIYDLAGNDVTQTVLDALDTETGRTNNALPVIQFTIGPGVMNDNGEIVGKLNSNYTDSTGRSVSFEEGKYYALVSGDNAAGQQVVGVYVVEGSDLRYEGVTVRETGGFILQR